MEGQGLGSRTLGDCRGAITTSPKTCIAKRSVHSQGTDLTLTKMSSDRMEDGKDYYTMLGFVKPDLRLVRNQGVHRVYWLSAATNLMLLHQG